MIRTIFFDFGNVIAWFDHWRAVRKFAAFTATPPEQLYTLYYDSPLEHAFEHGTISPNDYAAEAIKLGKLDCVPAHFLECFVDIFTPNADVIDLIPRLAVNHRLVLASNTNAAHFAHYCNQFAETLKHFAALPTSHQGGHRKPSEEFFAYCQKYAEAEANECAYVDDMAVNVAAGDSYGWLGVKYERGDRLEKKLQDVGIR